MKHTQPDRTESMRRIPTVCLAGALVAAIAGLALPVGAQTPACPESKFSGQLPDTVVLPPRAAEGPNSLAAFVDGVSQTDSAFEVIVGQGRILTTKVDLAVRGKTPALVAIGDPTIVEFAVVSARQVRVIGQRIGVTDLSITTPDNQTYVFEVRVVADLSVLRQQLKCLFPDACLKLTQVRDHIVLEGQARSSAQVNRIMETIQAYLDSVLASQLKKVTSQQRTPERDAPPAPRPTDPSVPGQPQPPPPGAEGEPSPITSREATIARPKVINMIRVPGPKQVLLQVRVAELNRTAFRQIGADFLARTGDSVFGTLINGATSQPNADGFFEFLRSPTATAFGIFNNGNFNVAISALRRNSLLKILAEPNLVALDGQAANFLAGGEFPVPVPQTGGGGIAPTITIQFKEFGVKLGFLPHIQDGDVIRLAVDPEVSSIDFTIGTTIVQGGSVVPGLNTRKAHTVVEMREGQTLAIAGLLQLTMDGQTNRIPGLGDLPVIGPFFSNTSGQRIEKELVVLVTPHLIEAMNHDQVPPSPGEEVGTPSDWEFYFHNRIEVPVSRDWRATTEYTTPLLRCMMKMDAKHIRGPSGFCD